jgi:hypothetical protein
MGWHVLGRPTASMLPTRAASIPALRGARTAARHWSEPVTAGAPAPELVGSGALDALVAAQPDDDRLRTRLDREVLAWRFGLPALAYRAVADDPDAGVAFVRVRRRGPAREAAVALALARPGRGARRAVFAAARRALRREADYLLAVGAAPGLVPVPRLGPVVTARAAGGSPPTRLRDLALDLADLELF